MRRLLAGVDARDVFAVVGFAALAYGVFQVSVPAAWIVSGLILLAVAVWPVIKRD
tara:strand:- start:9002 stop:9166 length:165 start_codon:yes stop_codon:yes gene_type:complete